MCRRRLLIVIDGMEVGGSQRQVQHLLGALDWQRWEPELAYFREHSFLVDAIRDQGIPVHYLPKRRRFDPSFLLAYARLLRRADYALIHAFSLTAELASIMARSLSGRRPRIIASERSFALDRPAWFWRLKRFVVRRSVAVIANSRAGAQATARRTGQPLDRFAVVANGVEFPTPIDATERAQLRRELGVGDGRLLGLFVGRLVPVKNLPSLIRALHRLDPAQRPRVALAGSGPERDLLLRLAAELGVSEDLHFLGERNDTARLIQAADFLVLPSHFEGLSNALLEAMAAGCPVIATAVGGNLELVENERTGLHFPCDDDLALASAMQRLGAPELRRQLSTRALEYVRRNHSCAALAAATSAVYERSLRDRTDRCEAPVGDAAQGSTK